MTDLGDLLDLPVTPEPRAQHPCRNPRCRRPVYVDRAVYGYGEGCAEDLGLTVYRARRGAGGQTGPDLFTAAAADALAAELAAGGAGE